MNKSTVARKYREKHGSDMPTLKLARIMYKENSLLFNHVEDARTSLRYIEGKSGGGQYVKDIERVPDRPKNPYNLPASDETNYDPFILNHKKILLLSDIHIPYHSISALTAAFDFAKKQKPDAVLLNGDTIDFFGLSRFCKEPGKRSFAEELKMFAEFFIILQKTFKCPIYMKEGNHEVRYNHFLWQKAGELDGVEEFKLEEIIKKRAPGVKYIGGKTIIKAGGLNILHGHEFSQTVFSPVNIARGLFLRAKVSSLQSHCHQVSEHTEPDLNKGITTCWSTGCLCELYPDYMPINKWSHGFAIVDVDGENFEVQNKRIFKGRVL